MHRLLWVGSEIHTRESRSLVAATTARLPIDTLRAQSPPNTGSTIQSLAWPRNIAIRFLYFSEHRFLYFFRYVVFRGFVQLFT